MIVAPDFVWLHFPKTGGHTVAAAIRSAAQGRSDLVFDGPKATGWHDSLIERRSRDRRFDPRGKLVLSGIRRLPWWILSRIHYEAARPPHNCATREMLCRGEYFEHGGEVNTADAHVLRLCGDQPVDRWLRLEHLTDDFVGCFESLLGAKVHRATRRLRKLVNANPVDYLKTLSFYFTARELEDLYRANPAWAAIERKIYGGLLSL